MLTSLALDKNDVKNGKFGYIWIKVKIHFLIKEGLFQLKMNWKFYQILEYFSYPSVGSFEYDFGVQLRLKWNNILKLMAYPYFAMAEWTKLDGSSKWKAYSAPTWTKFSWLSKIFNDVSTRSESRFLLLLTKAQLQSLQCPNVG